MACVFSICQTCNLSHISPNCMTYSSSHILRHKVRLLPSRFIRESMIISIISIHQSSRFIGLPWLSMIIHQNHQWILYDDHDDPSKSHPPRPPWAPLNAVWSNGSIAFWRDNKASRWLEWHPWNDIHVDHLKMLPVIKHGWLDKGPLIPDFPIRTSICRRFSIAMLDY